MRIDPEAVYLEISEASTIFNLSTGEAGAKPTAVLHWKDGNRWHRRSFIASEHNGETLGAILARVGEWIDNVGLTTALDQASRRDAA